MQFQHPQDLIAYAVNKRDAELASRLREQARFHAATAAEPNRSGHGMAGALHMALDCARAANYVDEGNWGAIVSDGIGMMVVAFNAAAYLCGLSPAERKELADIMATGN